MNLNLITYEDKEQINVNADIPKKNKVTANDMNEIKDALNTLIIPKLLNIFYPIGSYYETSDTSFDPNTSMGGTWELETDGTVLVSKSNTTGSKFNASIDSVVGEETHTLTVEEMPSHQHGEYIDNRGVKKAFTLADGGGSTLDGAFINITATSYTGQQVLTTSTGGGQAHNNVQPSKIVNRWHRTA